MAPLYFNELQLIFFNGDYFFRNLTTFIINKWSSGLCYILLGRSFIKHTEQIFCLRNGAGVSPAGNPELIIHPFLKRFSCIIECHVC